MSDRVALVEWMPQTSRRNGMLGAARGWLRQAMAAPDASTLSARLRRDVGLGGVPAATAGVLDFEARRLGF